MTKRKSSNLYLNRFRIGLRHAQMSFQKSFHFTKIPYKISLVVGFNYFERKHSPDVKVELRAGGKIRKIDMKKKEQQQIFNKPD